MKGDQIKPILEAAATSDNPAIEEALAMLVLLTTIAEAERIEYLKRYPIWPQFYCGCCC